MERENWTDTPLDPRRERLVALLYDELSTEEAAEVRGWLDTDPNLREEWNELVEARSFLRAPEVEAAAPQFIFLDPIAPATSTSALRPGARGRFRFSPGWVFALTTAALAALLLAGFRVDRNDDGLVLSFHTATEPSPPVEPAAVVSAPVVLPEPVGLGTVPPGGPQPEIVQVSVPEYVTPAEFRRMTEAMLGTVAGILDQKERTQREEMGFLVRVLYQRMREEEDSRYREILAQIDGVGLGLLAEQTRTSARLDALVGIGAPRSTSQPSDPDNGPSRAGQRP